MKTSTTTGRARTLTMKKENKYVLIILASITVLAIVLDCLGLTK